MFRNLADVLAAWAVCVLMLMLDSAALPELLRPVTGGLFLASVLYLLYAALTVILYHDFRLELRIALTIAVFLCATIFSGILLNATPWGLTRQSWMGMYTLIAGVALLVSTIGRLITGHKTPIRWHLQRWQAGMFAAAGVLLIAAFLLARLGLSMQPAEGFTQFWMLPADEPQTLTLGIFNVEHGTQRYFVELSSAQAMLGQWREIVLQPGEKWEVTVDIPVQGVAYPLVAELYIPEQEEAYRHLEFWPQAAAANG